MRSTEAFYANFFSSATISMISIPNCYLPKRLSYHYGVPPINPSKGLQKAVDPDNLEEEITRPSQQFHHQTQMQSPQPSYPTQSALALVREFHPSRALPRIGQTPPEMLPKGQARRHSLRDRLPVPRRLHPPLAFAQQRRSRHLHRAGPPPRNNRSPPRPSAALNQRQQL